MQTLKKASFALAGISLVISVLLGLIEVVGRYLFGVSHSAATEVMQWLLVGGVLLCTGPAWADDAHVGVDQLLHYFPGWARRAARVFTDVAGLAFGLVLTWQGVSLSLFAYRVHERSLSESQAPMFIPYLFLPAGGMLLVVFVVLRALRRFRPEGSAPESNPHTTGG